MFRRIFIYAALALVGGVMVGPALAKTTTRSCANVTVGRYQATKVRATSKLGCQAARHQLSQWLRQPTKLPHNSKRWHAKLVKGTWQMAYGKSPTSLYFVLVKLTPPKPTRKPAQTPQPTPQPRPTPTPAPTPTPTQTPSAQSQMITFTSTVPSNPKVGDTYTVAATASSKLPVTFSIDPGGSACSLKGSVVTFTGAGTCVIDANQAGDSAYKPAAQVTQSFTVLPASSMQVSLTVGGQPIAASYPWSKTGRTAVASCTDDTGLTCKVTATVDGTAVPSPDSITLPTDVAGKSQTIVVSATDNVGGSVSKTYTYSVAAVGWYGMAFDDGPNPTYTPLAIKALQDPALPGLIPGPNGAPAHIPATFFLCGANTCGTNGQAGISSAQGEALAIQQVADGFVIGDHTWDHLNIGDSTDTVNPFDGMPCANGQTATASPTLTTWRASPFSPSITGLCPQFEIEDTAYMIHSVTGVWPQFFRPPFGDYGPATGPSANGQTNAQNTTTLLNTVTSDLTAKYGAPAGYSMALTAWSVDSTDSNSPAPTLAAIVAASATVQNGGVLLMHDDNQNTVDSIPQIVNALAAKGLLPGRLATTTAPQFGPWNPLPPYYVTAVAP